MQRVFVGVGVLIASMLIGCGKNSIYVDDGEVNVIGDIPTLPKGDDGDDTTTLVQPPGVASGGVDYTPPEKDAYRPEADCSADDLQNEDACNKQYGCVWYEYDADTSMCTHTSS